MWSVAPVSVQNKVESLTTSLKFLVLVYGDSHPFLLFSCHKKDDLASELKLSFSVPSPLYCHRCLLLTSTSLLSLFKVTRLCDLSVEGDSVTSVGWSERVSMLLLKPGFGAGNWEQSPTAEPVVTRNNSVVRTVLVLYSVQVQKIRNMWN